MPPHLTAQDFDPEVLILFDAYVHGKLDRRGFLDRGWTMSRR
jgi:carboxymethylenebutenolidase